MKKSSIIALAALATAAYFLFFRKDRKENNNTTETGTEPETEPAPDEENRPETTETEPVIETIVNKEPCPYCATPNAVVKRTYRDKQLTQLAVECGNKSCPGPHSKQNVYEIVCYSGKTQGAGAQTTPSATKKAVVTTAPTTPSATKKAVVTTVPPTPSATKKAVVTTAQTTLSATKKVSNFGIHPASGRTGISGKFIN